MFGSKIRSWMEHVVRPRKKGNKNKNGNGNLVSTNTASEYKGTVYQNETNITSPATVSPIQIHNTSRKGWQSPNQEITLSPKPDYPYNSNTTIIKGKPIISSSVKEESIITKTTTTSTPKLLQKKFNKSSSSLSAATTTTVNVNGTRYLTTAPTTMYQMNEIDLNMKSSLSANGMSTSSTSTTKTINNNTLHYNYSTATSSSNEILDEAHLSNNKVKYIPIGISSSSSSVNSSVPNAKQQMPKEANNNNLCNLTSKEEHKYGKIQPINKYIEKYRIPMKNADRFNGNTTSEEFSHLENNINNNNTNKYGKPINCQLMPNNNSIKSNTNTYLGGHPNQNSNGNKYHHPHQRNGNGNLIVNNSHQTMTATTTPAATNYPPSNHNHHLQMGYHIVNHVSSPESAYSTGYSTDGTSPGGCSYTPEYYINMRTGVHYFPKGVSNTIGIDSSNRFKCGLNRIEEKYDEQICIHKRTESCDFGQNVNLLSTQSKSQTIDYNRSKIMTTPATAAQPSIGTNSHSNKTICSTSHQIPSIMSPVLRKNVALAAHFRTPSPRQRCRIRTNPWFSTTVDPILQGNDLKFSKKKDLDSGSTSSGIKSNSDESNEKNGNRKIGNLSDSDTSSSSTEKNASRTYKSMTEFKKTSKKENQLDSDDDATLNEMMGKFDESYVYEKENDILSDSDPTDCCVSDDFDGRDAGDECDSEDLLEIDYIDNGTANEVDADKEKYKNTGNCSYHFTQEKDKKTKSQKVRKSGRSSESSKRRKKVLRKRNKNSESSSRTKSPVIYSNRGCRSVGGTPVSIRRNDKSDKKQLHDMPLSNRSNSLTFTEIHAIRSRMLAISDSEKALIKADLEADVKYKQLIQEAETILISLKTHGNGTPAIKEQPAPLICSPRRICNVPTNKRVEMLRNCEVDLKRELSKTTTTHKIVDTQTNSPLGVVNKRLEILRYETVSAPSSPRTNRVAPMKTHITNFICQNPATTEMIPRKVSLESANSEIDNIKKSPQLQLNGKTFNNVPKSPALPRRRFHNQKPIDSDSDSDNDNPVGKPPRNRNDNKENNSKQSNKMNGDVRKPPLISFRSVVCNNIQEDSYFPQSEPLKRKIYTCSSTMDKIQRSLDFDSESPKKALLQKIQILRQERQADKLKEKKDTEEHVKIEQLVPQDSTDDNVKRKLIMKTIEDIKRSLEDQSLELNELHDSDT